MLLVALYNQIVKNMITQKFYPTIVLSDIHLGTEHSKTTELTNFLRTVNCNTLILNGDIIDGWNLQKSGKGKWGSAIELTSDASICNFKGGLNINPLHGTIGMWVKSKEKSDTFAARGKRSGYLDRSPPF